MVKYRSSTVTADFTQTNTRTPTEPAGAQSLDILIATVYIESNTSITAPAGWNLINRIDVAANHSAAHYWIRRGTSAPALQWNFGASIYNGIAIVCYSGCEANSSPLDVTPSTNSSTTGSTLTASAITPTTANCMIIGLFTHFVWGTHSSTDFTNERSDAGATGATAVYDDDLLVMPASTGNLTATNAAGSGSWTAVMLALKPSAYVTRLYLQNSPAQYSPTTHRGAWDTTASAIDLRLGKQPFGPAATKGVAETNSGAGYDVELARFVSDPLPANYSFTASDTVEWVYGVLESNAAADFYNHIHIFVTQGDGDTPRGTLLTDNIGDLEWTNAATGDGDGVQPLEGTVDALAGDRIVVEVGYRSQNTVTTSRTGTINYGNEGTIDLTDASTAVTTRPGWVEFSTSADLFAPVVKTFYLANAAAPYSPATYRGAWDSSASIVDKLLGDLPYGSNTYQGVAETNVNSGWDVMLSRFVSAGIGVNYTFTTSDVIEWAFGAWESNAAADFYGHVHIYVTSGDSDTPRGTLVTDKIGATEWGSTATADGEGRVAVEGTVSAQAGDRIVVEIGYRSQNTVTTSREGRAYYGGPMPCLPDGATTVTANVGWVRFTTASMVFKERIRATKVWTCPTGIDEVSVELWGAGGGGGGADNVEASGQEGGGGGGYSKDNTTTVSAGSYYLATVGTGGAGGAINGGSGAAGGDTNFVSSATVLAKGGGGGTGTSGNTVGTGGAAASGVGDTKYSGGNGGLGATSPGGGGGGAGGTGADGTVGADGTAAGSGAAGGAGGSLYGGTGGAGGNSATAGSAGVYPGGGGGGAGGTSDVVGGAGADGTILINPVSLVDATTTSTSTTSSSSSSTSSTSSSSSTSSTSSSSSSSTSSTSSSSSTSSTSSSSSTSSTSSSTSSTSSSSSTSSTSSSSSTSSTSSSTSTSSTSSSTSSTSSSSSTSSTSSSTSSTSSSSSTSSTSSSTSSTSSSSSTSSTSSSSSTSTTTTLAYGLVIDGGIERADWYVPWSEYLSSGDQPVYTHDSTVKRSGGYSIKEVAASTTDGGRQQGDGNNANFYPLAAGDYHFSGWVKTGSGVTNANCLIRRHGGDWAVVAGGNITTENQDWTELSGNFTANGTDNFDILIGLGAYGSASSGTVWFDDISLTYIEATTTSTSTSSTSSSSSSSTSTSSTSSSSSTSSTSSSSSTSSTSSSSSTSSTSSSTSSTSSSSSTSSTSSSSSTSSTSSSSSTSSTSSSTSSTSSSSSTSSTSSSSSTSSTSSSSSTSSTSSSTSSTSSSSSTSSTSSSSSTSTSTTLEPIASNNDTTRVLNLDGSGDYAEVADDDSLSVTATGELTISVWIRPDVLEFPVYEDTGYVHWLGKKDYSPTRAEWLFRMYNLTNDESRPNRISFYVFNTGGGIGVGSYFQDSLTAGEWIHVVGKVDSTYTYIYKNGSLRDSDNYTASITPGNTTAPLRIGSVTPPDSFFKGAIDDVRIYNRALSDTEVSNLYSAGRGGGGTANGLIHRWKFDEASGSTADDEIGSLDATLYGDASFTTTSTSTSSTSSSSSTSSTSSSTSSTSSSSSTSSTSSSSSTSSTSSSSSTSTSSTSSSSSTSSTSSSSSTSSTSSSSTSVTETTTSTTSSSSSTSSTSSSSSTSTSTTLLPEFYRGVSSSGGEFTADADHLPGTYNTDYHYDSDASFEFLASRGHKIIRLPFRWERIQPTRNAALDSTELTRITNVATSIESWGMRVVLDVHNYARYINSTANGGAELVLGSTLPVSDLVDLWTRLSTAFKNNAAIYAYGLMNEPHDLSPDPGDLTGSVRYDWNDGTTQGWTGDSATATNVSNKLRLTATATDGYFNFRKDDAGTLAGSATGSVLRMKVTLGAGISGTWVMKPQWQNQAYSWKNADTIYYQRTDTGEWVSNLVANVEVEVTAIYTTDPISSPRAFAIQVESNNATAGTVSADIDDFAQGSLNSFKTAAQVWESASQDLVDAIRANGDTKRIMVSGYDWSGAQIWSTTHPTPWITDSANNFAYEAHYYFDTGNSGAYNDTYATTNTAAQGMGYTDLADRVTQESSVFFNWITSRSLAGFIGETGWRNDESTTDWNAVGEVFYDLMDLWHIEAAYWATGEWWGTSYKLSAYTGEPLDTLTTVAPIIEGHPTEASSTTTSTTSSSSSTSSTSSSSSTSSTSSSSSSSSTSTTSTSTVSTTTTLEPVGALVFGEQNPTDGETPIKWSTWSGTGSITGDADWGKLHLENGQSQVGSVYDHGTAENRQYSLTLNKYGTGQGSATLSYRGSASAFNTNDVSPSWTPYTGVFTATWRYIQVKEAR